MESASPTWAILIGMQAFGEIGEIEDGLIQESDASFGSGRTPYVFFLDG
jgi:hypothetical protein